MLLRPWSHCVAALLLHLTVLVGVAAAQPATTTLLTGRSLDASGAVMPGVVVRIVHDTTAIVVVETVTDHEGRYEAVLPAPGHYRVDASLDGFETAVLRVELDAGQTATLDITMVQQHSEAVVVTARRIEESLQAVPIPVSVVSGRQVADAGAFNVNRLKELVPTIQFYSSNPRNSAVNIRGLGLPFGLTNDGIEPGVGMYIDGVYFARSASATLDFLDVERIEVLRGPQGTLFGKNTTAGALHITTRKPGFRREVDAEISYGSLGFLQVKTAVAGPLARKTAGRLSFSGTTRDGILRNTATGQHLNDLDNLGTRGQVLFAPSDRLAITAAADYTRQRPRGYAQVVAGVAPTRRSAARQYPQIASDLGYQPPSFDAFSRLTDADTPHQSYQDTGGASVTIDVDAGAGRVTSITAWRAWTWDPSNDRDFLGLPVTTISANPSRQRQWSQEVRYAGALTPSLGVVAGAFAFHQSIDSTGKQEQGAAAARFLLAPSVLAATPGLLDGYGSTSDIRSSNTSAALFGQLEWSPTTRLRVLPGLRLNHDQKALDYRSEVYGGLQTTDPALIALQRSVLAPQVYAADVADTNVSGQLTLAYAVAPSTNVYATYSTSFKSVGLNLNGVPADAAGRPSIDAATVKPESVRHVEAGVKTELVAGLTANLSVYDTVIDDFQANVVNAQVGVLRGYLANADKVRVRGAEVDARAQVGRAVSVFGAAAFSDGRYVRFTDAPPPLEETGGPAAKDISGSVLPGLSRWTFAAGAEVSRPATVLRRAGELFGAIDGSYRSAFSSSPSASRYLVIDGYGLFNARAGFRWGNGWVVSVWGRNLLDQRYYELLSAAPGNSGLYVGLPGDPRTVGVTLRMSLRGRR